MYEPFIKAALPSVQLHDGFPSAMDQLAVDASSPRGFLRSAWYGAPASDSGQTLLGKRADGTLFAAIPTARLGPGLIGLRSVPGCYWPLRSPLLAGDVLVEELAHLLGLPTSIKALGPAWRLGPTPAQDPVTRLFARAAAMAGWSVLERPVGKSWILDLAGAASEGRWPGKSSAKRLRQYERRLSEEGRVTWRCVSGTDWNDAALDQMAQVERDSWVASQTDGSGAKFLQPRQRDLWRKALADPHIARLAQATILALDDRPIAFSFDIVCGTLQYAIASSFAQDMGHYRVGNMVTHGQLKAALDQGVTTIDLGAGDSGYKRQMGAVEGYDFVDLMIVRSALAARFVALKWGGEPADLRQIRQSALALRGSGHAPWQGNARAATPRDRVPPSGA